MGTLAPDAVKRLVDRFDQDRKVFLSPDYKEEQLRAEFPNGPSPTVRRSAFGACTFLDPFFAALGWDMGIVKNTIRRLCEGGPAQAGPPACLTNVCLHRKMQPMSAKGRLALEVQE